MKYVYLIKSESHTNKTYVGVTSNLIQRLTTHNGGGSVHTSKFTPWTLLTYVAFSDDSKALAFEAYLKTGLRRVPDEPLPRKDCGNQECVVLVSLSITRKPGPLHFFIL